MTVPPGIGKHLVTGESLIAHADVKVDVRSHGTNAEVPVPWTDLAKPRHYGIVALTNHRLLIVFNPGNVRVVSVPLTNVLMVWERTAEGRKPYPNQVVFLLPAGMFCVCELEGCEVEPITELRRIMHTVTRMGAIGARDHSSASPDFFLGDDGGVTAAIAATI